MSELTPTQALNYLNNVDTLSPQMQKLVCNWRDIFYEVSLHTKGARPKFKDLSRENGGEIIPPRYLGQQYQDLFDKYLLARHPRESEVTRQWRYSQYRPFTKAPFGMLTDVLKGAIFQDSQYTLVLPDREDNEYIWGNNFTGKPLVQFFADICLPAIMEDPNGFVVRIPSKPWYEQAGRRVEVSVFFVSTKDIIYAGPQDFVFKQQQLNGSVYGYWITDLTIFRYVQPANGGQFVLEDRGYFAHMLGHLPVSVAGGIWNTEGYYDSYYDKAIAAANEFISSFSAEQMIDKEASHPYIVQVAEDCPECKGVCEVTLTDYDTGQPRKVKCPTCKGKGQISISPGDRLQVPMEDWEKGKGDFIKIVNPDVNINKYHRDKNAQVMEMILRALNLLNIDAAQSGTAKAIDMEKLWSFISTVNNNLFDNHIGPTARDIIAYRNVRATPTGTAPYVYDFTLIKPTQFQIKTAADLMLELTESTKGNIPGYIRKKQVIEFVDKRFAGDDVFQRKTEVIAALDDLFVYSADELMTKRTMGQVDAQDLIYSRKLPGILDDLIQEKGTSWFQSAKMDDIRTLVDERMAPFLQAKEFALVDDNGNPTDNNNDET
jgi:hypothetical protein